VFVRAVGIKNLLAAFVRRQSAFPSVQKHDSNALIGAGVTKSARYCFLLSRPCPWNGGFGLTAEAATTQSKINLVVPEVSFADP
jgi:hypothetical protein